MNAEAKPDMISDRTLHKYPKSVGDFLQASKDKSDSLLYSSLVFSVFVIYTSGLNYISAYTISMTIIGAAIKVVYLIYSKNPRQFIVALSCVFAVAVISSALFNLMFVLDNFKRIDFVSVSYTIFSYCGMLAYFYILGKTMLVAYRDAA